MEILICGRPAESRIVDLLPRLAGHVAVRGAHTKDALLKQLARGHQPICVLEHEVPTVDPVKSLSIFRLAAAVIASKTQFTLSPSVTAYELLSQLVASSPSTRFVITSHTRGFGISPEQRALYKERPEVLKVMGFINSQENTNYLLTLFSRVYLGKTWKAETDA